MSNNGYLKGLVILAILLLTGVASGGPVALQANFKIATVDGLTVTFNDLSTPAENVTEWYWDFTRDDPMADEPSSSQQNPTHTFPGAGTYAVLLHVGDGLGSYSNTIEKSVTVGEEAQPEPMIPVASYSASYPSPGYAPLTVQFTDTSVRNPTSWEWNFDDGSPISTEQNPTHIFRRAGTYEVGLTASNINGSHTYVGSLYVEEAPMNQLPEAVLSTDVTEGSVPLTVQCRDDSLRGESWITSFGDGTSSDQRDPMHTYTEAGVYTIELNVTNIYGSDTDSVQITVNGETATPVVSFTANVTEGDAPLTVGFTDTSDVSMLKDPKYKWELGGEATSSVQNPVHTFGPGEHNVILTISENDPSGYTGYIPQASTVINVTDPTPVVPPVASFTIDKTSGPAPLTVSCVDTSENSVYRNWYSDGEWVSDETTTMNTYETVGQHEIKLDITDDRGQHDIEIKYVTVTEPEVPPEPVLPIADFSANVTKGIVPLTVQFTDLSDNATGWEWNFGNGDSSVAQNPIYTFLKVGIYEVELNASNGNGSSQKLMTINVTDKPVDPVLDPVLPVANFNANITEGFVPLAVKFTDLSENATGWKWDFGDGNDSIEAEPIHIYDAAGTYTVNLTVSNMNGTDSMKKSITVKEKIIEPDPEPEEIMPVANFNANISSGYVPLDVQFTDTSTGEPNVWKWDFGDGNTSDDQNPTHLFAAAGTYKVNLTVSNDNGTDSYESNIVVQAKIIEPDPEKPILPFANFEANITEGFEPLAVQFTDLSENATGWKWDFGDGKTSDDTEPIHIYETAGNYTVNLTVSNMNGTDSRELDIIVKEKIVEPDPEPEEGSLLFVDFTADVTSGFAPLEVNFTDLSKNATGWNWNFGDKVISTERNPSHTYSVPGKYTVTLTVENKTDTASKSSEIEVFEPEKPTLSYPTASFTSNVSEGYVPLVVKFTDTSDHATGWGWTFGDGKTSTEKNPIHTYMKPGSYKVTLNVSNANGNDSTSATITVKKAIGGSSEGGNNGGNGGSGGMPSPEKLVVKIKASKLCGVAPFCVQFYDISKAPTNGIIRVWNFGDGSEEYVGMNPAHTYKCADIYTVTLTLIDGSTRTCGDIEIKVLEENQKKDKEEAQTSKTTKKTEIKPDVCKAPKVKTIEDNQGDKQKSEVLEDEERVWGPCAFNAFNGGIITPIQLIKVDHHKAKKGNLFIFAIAEKPIAAFNAIVTEGKSPLSVQFNDQSTNYPILWKWDFGDGTISDDKNPVHKYSKPGIYTVSLTVKNYAGGTKLTKMDYIVVN